MSFNDRIQKLNYSFTPKTLRNRLINSAASSMLRHNGGNNLIVLVPATPVNTFCSNLSVPQLTQNQNLFAINYFYTIFKVKFFYL